ncbi:Kelch repeat-containing protein [Marinicrinis sediminis]|uniref:Kelch repeat-containing protein n=1 Tax=Marinicrinis sediminis TaxID=1652465 RepID=A0ABW5RBF5_9BACL
MKKRKVIIPFLFSLLLLFSLISSASGSNVWTTFTELPKKTTNFAYASVGDKVYVIGGYDGTNVLNSVYEFDVNLKTWTQKADAPTSRWQADTAVYNGEIYVFGGTSNVSPQVPLNTVEKYNPVTNTWTTLTPMTVARYLASAVMLNNKIYVIGGGNGQTYQDVVEIYDPQNDTWSTASNMLTPRENMDSVVLSGKIYVMGGKALSSYVNTMEMYDPATNTWTTKSSLSTSRSNMSAVIYNQQILVLGGYNGSNLTSIESYNPASNSWTNFGNLPIAKRGFGTAVMNNEIITFGGYGADVLDRVDAYVAQPDAPLNLTANAGNQQVVLNWEAVTDAIGYNVKRSTTSGGPYTTVATSLAGTTYTDANLTNGTTYYYVVTAIDQVESTYSNEVSATPNYDNRAILVITMQNGLEKEYDLSMTEVNQFLDWYSNRDAGIGLPYYKIQKTSNIGPFISRTDYIIFDKMMFFEINEYTFV